MKEKDLKRIESMPLDKIKDKYGDEILKYELKRRAAIDIHLIHPFLAIYSNLSELNLQEINNKDQYLMANYIKNACLLLDKTPQEVMMWDTVTLSYKDAQLFLTDDSWLSNDNLVAKVPHSFLFDTLLKDGNIYKYAKLLNNLEESYLEELFLRDDIDFEKIEIVDSLIKKLPTMKLEMIVDKLLDKRALDLIIIIINKKIVSDLEIRKIGLKAINKLNKKEFINLLDNCPHLIKIFNYNELDNFCNNLRGEEALLFLKKQTNNLDLNMKKKLINNLAEDYLYKVMLYDDQIYLIYKEVYNTLDTRFNIIIDNILYFKEESLKNINRAMMQDFINWQVILPNEKLQNLINILEPDIWERIFQNKDLLSSYLNNTKSIFGKYSFAMYIKEQKNWSLPKLINLMETVIESKGYTFGDFKKLLRDIPELVNVLKDNYLGEVCQKYKIDSLEILEEYPVLLEKLQVNDKILNVIMGLESYQLLKVLDTRPLLEKTLISNEKFLNYVVSDKKRIIEYMPLLNKYHISNEIIRKYNNNFQKLLDKRPELSWGNTSLRYEFLEDDFINILGVEYTNAILAYDSEETNKIVINCYKEKKLENLKKWLDLVGKNISNNQRMMHFSIWAYPKMQDLIKDIGDINLETGQLQILEEIIDNQNLYDIKTLQELNNYFQIKATKILKTKEKLTKEDILELFLNTSSLKIGIPWGLRIDDSFWDKLDYYNYRFGKMGVIATEEIEYLQKIKNILQTTDNMALIMNLVNENLEKQRPTARSILTRIINAENKIVNEQLLDLEKLKKVASYTDKTAPVYMENKDGVLYITLNDYDYKAVTHHLISKLNDGRNATFSDTFRNDYEQYRIFGEKLKEKLKDKNLSKQQIGVLLREDPEAWKLIDGISTVSCGIASPYKDLEAVQGYAWGKNSNLHFLGSCGTDAGISHLSRDLMPEFRVDEGMMANLNTISWGEFWFDRRNSHNERITPEFILSSTNSEGMKQDVIAAKYFNCPIVIDNNKYRGDAFVQRRDMLARKEFIVNFDIKQIDAIIYNYANKDDNEKVDFILKTLDYGYQNKKFSREEYVSKLEEFKWFLYEHLANQCFKVDKVIASLNNNLEVENSLNMTTRLGKINIILWLILLGMVIILGFMIAWIIK